MIKSIKRKLKNTIKRKPKPTEQPAATTATTAPAAAPPETKGAGTSASTKSAESNNGYSSDEARPRLSSYASTGDDRSTDGSVRSQGSGRSNSQKNPKKLIPDGRN